MAALLLAIMPLMLPGCGEKVVEAEPPVKPVKTVTLGEEAGTSTRVFPGTLRASERAQLSFRVSGPLTELPIKEGMDVRKGQLLAQIDPRDFQTAVDNLQAQSATLAAQRRAMDHARPEDIAKAEATLEAARARLLEAEANFRRYRRLYENDNVSLAEFDQRRAARDVAEADVAAAQEALKIARSGARVEDIEAMDARILSLKAQLRKAQDNLQDTSLRAPYAGTVAQRYVDNFEFVQAQEPILSLQNTEIMELVSQLPESVIAQSNEYKAAHGGRLPEFYATFPALPGKRVKANPTEIATQADPVTRTYSAIFQIPQPPGGRVLAGMTGEIHLVATEEAGARFAVPVDAVFTDPNGDSCVWRLTNSETVERVKVGVGGLTGNSIEIASGVERGDKIVTAGASSLQQGQKVREITTELRERK